MLSSNHANEWESCYMNIKRLIQLIATAALLTTSLPGIAGSRSCSNVEIDSSKLAVGDLAIQDYLGGANGKYILDVLKRDAGALTFDVTVPNDKTLFKQLAGLKQTYVALLCFPTASNNSLQDYNTYQTAAFPASSYWIPKMMRKGDQAQPERAGKHYPLIVYGHGSATDFISDAASTRDYASLTIFFGDCRTPKDSLICPKMTANLPEIFATGALVINAAVEAVLAHPDFGRLIDQNRIGVSGQSRGSGSGFAALTGTISTIAGGDQLATFSSPGKFKSARFDGPASGFSNTIVSKGAGSASLFGKGQRVAVTVQQPIVTIIGSDDTAVSTSDLNDFLNQSLGFSYQMTVPGQGHPPNCPTCNTVADQFEAAFLQGDLDAYNSLMSTTLSTATLLARNKSASQARAQEAASDRFFSWAETSYPALFPSHQHSIAVQGYYVRCYENNYCLGQQGGQLWFYDGQAIHTLGSLQAYMKQVIAAGY